MLQSTALEEISVQLSYLLHSRYSAISINVHAHETFGLNKGLFEYAKAVAESLEISCSRNSHRIVVCREHTGSGAEVSGTRGYCQGCSSAGQG